jgi:small GTP-binding protein
VSEDNHGHVVSTRHQRDHLRKRIDLKPEKVQARKIAALYKIIMLGDSGTGKTSLLLRFTENVFNITQNCTIGIDFKMKHVKIDERIVKLQIWDTAGQERFKAISSQYLRNAHGAIAVYDVTKRESFENLKS